MFKAPTKWLLKDRTFTRVFDFPPSDLMRPRYCLSADARMRMQNALLLYNTQELESLEQRPCLSCSGFDAPAQWALPCIMNRDCFLYLARPAAVEEYSVQLRKHLSATQSGQNG